MKKKNLVVLGFCILALTGCAGPKTEMEQTVTDTVINVQSTVQESEVAEEITAESETVQKEEGKINPLPPEFAEVASEDMPDGEYNVYFESGDLKQEEGGYTLTMEFYDYDRYAKEDILSMKQGDCINITVMEYDGEKAQNIRKDVKVESIEFVDNTEGEKAFAIINGGIEEDGIELAYNADFEIFENLIWDDCPVFYSIGEARIPVSKDMTFQDCIDYETLPDGVITYYEDLPNSIMEAEEKGVFTNNSTSAVIRNGEIIQLIRRWTP